MTAKARVLVVDDDPIVRYSCERILGPTCSLRLVDSGRAAKGKKAPKKGRMTPAQLLVRGSVTHVQSSTTGGSGGIRFKGIRLGGSKDSAEVNITMYLVDTETGQVKASTKVVGKSGRRGLKVGYWGSKLGGLTGDLAGSIDQES